MLDEPTVVLAGQPFKLRCPDCCVDLTSCSQSVGDTITLGSVSCADGTTFLSIDLQKEVDSERAG